ncbi:hypothetical protein C7N43_39675 [Sphingobacteriales bacterium UPWRP_1]|nr:hypothetical protein C7N43_39675 [Sphingobacteriales bacterium UPWRP_1]
MEKRKLLQAIEKTQQITDVSLKELRELLTDFPYFQTGYLLMAQLATLSPDATNQQVLSTCATYAGNRERLHKLLADTRQQQQTGNAAAAEENRSLTTEENLPPQATPPLPETNNTEEMVNLNLTAKKNRPLLPLTDNVADDTDATTVIHTTDDWLDKIKGHTEDYADLETEEITLDTIGIEEEARKQVERELQITLNLPQTETETGTNTTQETTTGNEDNDDAANIETEALQLIEQDINTLTQEGAINPIQQNIENSVHSDNDLISNLKKRLEAYRQQKQPQFDQWLENQKTGQTEQPELTQPTELEEAPTLQTTTEEPPALTNNNLAPPPDDTNPKPQYEIPVFDFDDSYITETIARIFVRQENYAKAIAIYERLCLKYPEKNAYFAAKIEELKNKLT